jgi:hypothetical protein
MPEIDSGFVKQIIENHSWNWIHPKEVVTGNHVNIDGVLAKQISYNSVEHHLLLMPVCIVNNESMEIEALTHIESFVRILNQSLQHNTHLIQSILHYLGIEVDTQYDLELGIVYRVMGRRFRIQVQGLMITDTEISIPETNLSDADKHTLNTLLQSKFELLPQNGIYKVNIDVLSEFFPYYEQKYGIIRTAKKKPSKMSGIQAAMNLLSGLLVTVLGISNILVFFFSATITLGKLLISDGILLFLIITSYMIIYTGIQKKESRVLRLLAMPVNPETFVYDSKNYAVFEIIIRTISDFDHRNQFASDHLRVWLSHPGKFNKNLLIRLASEVPELFEKEEEESIHVIEMPEEESTTDEVEENIAEPEPYIEDYETETENESQVIEAEEDDIVSEAVEEADFILTPLTSTIPEIEEMISHSKGFLENNDPSTLEPLESFMQKNKKANLDKYMDKKKQKAFLEGL